MFSLIRSLFQKELKMSAELKIKSDYLLFEEKTNDQYNHLGIAEDSITQNRCIETFFHQTTDMYIKFKEVKAALDGATRSGPPNQKGSSLVASFLFDLLCDCFCLSFREENDFVKNIFSCSSSANSKIFLNIFV